MQATSPPKPEWALVERSRRGDRQAFEELVRQTARTLFYRLYVETGCVHKAEDLAQETFLSAWRSIRKLSDADAFRPWLFSIAHAVVIDSHRRESRKKRAAPATDQHLQPQPRAAPSPPEELELDERRQRVLAALRSLPNEYRQPLVLRYLNDADYQTIARELSISNGSLRGLLSRGMKLLRDKLKQEKEAL